MLKFLKSVELKKNTKNAHCLKYLFRKYQSFDKFREENKDRPPLLSESPHASTINKSVSSSFALKTHIFENFHRKTKQLSWSGKNICKNSTTFRKKCPRRARKTFVFTQNANSNNNSNCIDKIFHRKNSIAFHACSERVASNAQIHYIINTSCRKTTA